MNRYLQSISRMENELTGSESGLTSPAVSVVIMQEGTVLYQRHFGWRDQHRGLELWGNTLYNIGSISKLYVIVCILKLCGQGRLRLDAPVAEVLPGFAMADSRYRDITVRMLLDHSSGLPGGNYENWFLYDTDTNTGCFARLMAYLSQEHLKAAPGTFSIYCNEGFLLAQRIVELASGLGYSDFLHKEILTPMGLHNTHLSCEENQPEAFARGCGADGLSVPLEIITRAAAGTGGLCCTAENLAAFGTRVFDPGYGVLDENMIALFSQPQCGTLLGKRSPFNGMGWDYVGYRYGNRNVLTKGGGTTQYLNQLIAIPEAGLSIAGLSVAPSQINGILEQLAYDMMVEMELLQESPIIVPGAVSQGENVMDRSAASSQDIAEKYCVLGGPVMLNVRAENAELSIQPNPLSAIQNLDGGKPYTLREDGFYWLEAPDGRKCEAFTIMKLDFGTFLVQRVTTAAFQYEVAYAQRIEPEKHQADWAERNGSVWLKTGMLPNAIPMPMEDVVVLGVPADPAGHVLFLRDTPHRILSSDRAGASTPTERDCGFLYVQGEKLINQGVEYLSRDAVPTLRFHMTSICLKDKCQWVRIEADMTVAETGARLIAYDPAGILLWDSMVNAMGDIPNGGYLLALGVPGSTVRFQEKR